MKFKISYKNLQEADDGNTTHYGGTVTVNKKEYRACGTDRGTELLCVICEAIEEQLKRQLTNAESDAVDEKMMKEWPDAFKIELK